MHFICLSSALFNSAASLHYQNLTHTSEIENLKETSILMTDDVDDSFAAVAWAWGCRL